MKNVIQAAYDLGMKGLTPFDLLTWEYLVDLHERYKLFNGIDLGIHQKMQEEIRKALWKKAKMLDENGSDFHQNLLKKMDLEKSTA